MPKHNRQLRVKDLPKAPPYMVARVGFEPATFRTQGTEPTAEPPHPHISYSIGIIAHSAVCILCHLCADHLICKLGLFVLLQ